MTQEGESMTLKGEFQIHGQQRVHNPLQILSFWQKSNLPGHVIDISGASNEQNFSVIIRDTQQMKAHMVFSIACGADSKVETTDQFPPFRHYEHNIMLFHSRNILKHWRDGADVELICITMDINLLQRYLPLNKPAFSKFCNCIETGTSTMLSDTHLIISPKIATVLNDITTCVHEGFYKQLYLKAKVIELIALQFEQYEELIKSRSNMALELPDDILEKINKVRQILINDINTKLSLKELANKVGTNEYTLKTGFKKVFGTTVFGFLHEYKMEKARKMLLEQNIRIAEVSNEMGYKHATHFTNAFKKFFGYLPNKITLFLLLPFDLAPDYLLGLWLV